jgi:hypothetical protein
MCMHMLVDFLSVLDVCRLLLCMRAALTGDRFKQSQDDLSIGLGKRGEDQVVRFVDAVLYN